MKSCITYFLPEADHEALRLRFSIKSLPLAFCLGNHDLWVNPAESTRRKRFPYMRFLSLGRNH